MPISRLLLVLEVSNVHLTFRKPYAANVLVMSDLTLDPSFKFKNAYISLSIGWQCTADLKEIICFESFGDVSFDLGMFPRGQTRAGPHKAPYLAYYWF